MEIFFLVLNRNMLWHISFPAGCGWDPRTKSRGQGGYGQLTWEQNASFLSRGDLAQPAPGPAAPSPLLLAPPASGGLRISGWGLDAQWAQRPPQHTPHSLWPLLACARGGGGSQDAAWCVGASLSQRAHRKASSRQRHTEAPRTCGPLGVSPKAAASSSTRALTPRPPTLWSDPNLALRSLARPQELPAPTAWRGK